MSNATRLILSLAMVVAAATLFVAATASKVSAADIQPLLTSGSGTAVALADDDKEKPAAKPADKDSDKDADDAKDNGHKKPKTKDNPKDNDDDHDHGKGNDDKDHGNEGK